MFPVSAVRPALLLLQPQLVPLVQVGPGPPDAAAAAAAEQVLLLLLKFMYIHVYNTGSFSADTVINTTNHMQTYSGRKEDSKKASGKCTFLQVKILPKSSSTNINNGFIFLRLFDCTGLD